ncbi:MAG: hypothetical protein GEU28_12085 [Dehalococcoidia bacterium]|nr:hypothetical protein [Dehalococcoidia bacterium]
MTKHRVLAVAVALFALAGLACGALDRHEAVDVFVDSLEINQVDLCFDSAALPSDFEMSFKRLLDNDRAAQRRRLPEEAARDYEAWARVTGVHKQWLFVPPSAPDESAHGLLTEGQIADLQAAAAAEMDAAPFTALTCEVDVFLDQVGARDAFAAERTSPLDPSRPPDLQPTPAVVDQPGAAGDEGFVASFPYSESLTVVVAYRLDRVIVRVSVSAPCREASDGTCATLEASALSLASSMQGRILAEVGTDARFTADEICPERDHLACIEEFTARSEADTPAALCVTPLGGWFFETPRGGPDSLCSDDESAVVAVVGAPARG